MLAYNALKYDFTISIGKSIGKYDFKATNCKNSVKGFIGNMTNKIVSLLLHKNDKY